MTRRFCMAIVRVAAAAVPARDRERWRTEWVAEMDHSWRGEQSRRRRITLTARAFDAVTHALWIRKESISMDTLIQDARFAARMLWRERGFTAVAVVTLALGIGANTAIFSIVNRTLLRPLPFGHPESLVHVWETLPEQGILQNNPAPDTFDLWRSRTSLVTGMAAYTSATTNISGDGQAERLRGLRASANLLSVMEIQPEAGRGFRPDEDRFGAPRVVMLTDQLWARRYHRDPSVVGRTVTLDREPALVTGILPAELPLSLANVDVWIPLALKPTESKQSRMLWVVARTRPGVSAVTLEKDLDAAMHREGTGRMPDGIGVAVASMDEQLRGGVKPDLLMIFAVSAAVLLIACANVATMLLARGLTRRPEMAVRASLGAGRSRLARMLLIESAVLGLIGGAAGLLLGAWSVRAIQYLMPAQLASVVNGGLDAKVLAFSLITATVTALVAGLAPLAGSLSGSLVVTGRNPGGLDRRSTRWLRSIVVAGQMALAVVLLSGTALLTRTFVAIALTPTGFSSESVLTAEVPRIDTDDARRTDFYARLIERLSTTPGVRAAGLINGVPIRWAGGGSGFTIDGPAPRSVNGHHRIVSAGYFSAMSIPLLQGSVFTGGERKDDESVVVVSRSFADAAWPDGVSAVGQHIRWGADGSSSRVIGVVADVRLTRTAPPEPHVYLPFTQVQYQPYAPGDVVLKTAGPPGAMAGTLREAVRSLDPNQPVASVMTMDEIMARSLGRRRFTLSLMGTFALLALVLCAVGIYGVLNYSVRRQTRDIGVRIAIGATRGRVRAGVLRRGLALAATGAVAGVLASVLLARWMMSVVPGLTSLEPWPIAAAAAILVLVSVAACDIPARRAMRVDPVTALRDG
jgi:predicted permease